MGVNSHFGSSRAPLATAIDSQLSTFCVLTESEVMLARMGRTQQLPAVRAFSTVPVNSVARVIRFHCGNEENAVKIDGVLKDLLPGVQELAGFTRLTRTVCKAEWAYEIHVEFNSLENFQAYMGSKHREETAPIFLDAVKPTLPEGGEIYSGNRVVDDFE